MSEKPVVDLLIKVRTNFSSALSSVKKLETKVRGLLDTVERLEAKRVTLDIDTSGVTLSIKQAQNELETLHKLMEKAKTGRITEKELKQMKETAQQLFLQAKVKDHHLKLAEKALEKEKESVRYAHDLIEVERRKTSEASRQVDTLKQIVRTGGDIVDQTKIMDWGPEKLKALLEMTGKMPELSKEWADAVALGGKEYKKLLQYQKWTLPEVRDYINILYDGQRALSRSKKELDYHLDTMTDLKKAGKVTTEQFERYKAVTTETGARLDDTRIALNRFQKLSEDTANLTTRIAKEGGPLPYYQSTLRVLDDILKYRSEKFPFFRTFRLPKSLVEDMVQITHGMENSIDISEKWLGTIKNTIGTALTYTGQFDRRMRYLSRDLYIFGLYFDRLGKSAVARFKQLIQTSSDLEGAFEDLGIAGSDAMEPIMESIAPIVEDVAEVVEGIADFTENMPGRGAVGTIILLGTVFLSLFGTLMRGLSVINLFKNSAMVMIGQQKELAAAQADHERHLYNLGIQMQSTIEKLKVLREMGVDEAEVLKVMEHDFRVLDGEINRVRQEMVSFGGDTSRTLLLLAAGIDTFIRKVKAGEIDRIGLATKLGMDDARESLYAVNSTMEVFRRRSLEGEEGILSVAKALSGILLGKEVAPKEDILKELGYDQKVLAEQTSALTKRTKRSASANLRWTGSAFGMMVTGGLTTAMMTEMAGATDSLGAGFANLLQPFQPLFEAFERFTEWFEDITENMPGWGKALAGVGLILGGGAIGGVLTQAMSALSTKLWGILFGKSMVDAAGAANVPGLLSPIITKAMAVFSGFATWLGGILSATFLGIPVIGWVAGIILAIGLIWLAWKNNWGNIREKTKAVLDDIRGWLESISNWIRKHLTEPINEFFDRITGGGRPVVTKPGYVTPNVPELQTGGIVQRAGLFSLHPGETILPSNMTRDLSRSSITNHIYVTVAIDRSVASSIDENTIGRIVSDHIARQLGRRI